MSLKYIFVALLSYLHYQINKCNSETLTYISTERPMIYWHNPEYIKSFTILSRRLRRQDPRHYVDIFIHSLVPATNDFKLDFYFYQFLTNRYRRSFVEMHFKFCDMLDSDTIFGPAIKKALDRDCPLPPGEYHLKNMTIPYVPRGFPFTKGRIYCNGSYGTVAKQVFSGSIDMEIKVAKINKN